GEDIAEYNGTTNFTDVKAPTATEDGSWFAPYVEWAAENGITTGVTPTTFEPNKSVSRQDAATLIYRYLVDYEKVTLPADKAMINFTDADKIGSWATDAVEALVKAGIINGIEKDDGSFEFQPTGTTLREQAAAMLDRMISALPEDNSNENTEA
ncbi:MAG: S-layer homology domain-containing protein, partial [Bacillota bacterium]|nr:S-layer homology domain-containing protein [Bacillota bacterium]